MNNVTAFIRSHPLVTYFALAFVISWAGVLLVAGPGGISVDREPPEGLLPFVYLAMLVGPSVAGILLTGLVHGRSGLRELLSRLLTWRVAARWYGVALVTAPVLIAAILLTLSLLSPEFLPGIATASDKASVLLISMAAGLVVGIFEELGWTGFAVPRIRLRRGVLATGLIVGVLWGAWHFLVFFWGSRVFSGALSPAIFLPAILFSFLPVFRVLMVWVYDRTESLLIAILMHASLTSSTYIFMPSATGVPAVTYDLALAVVLWIVVAVVAAANGGQLSRQAPERRVA